ncbi:MAG TPA: hypothetical protein VLK23_12800, partial [Thermodesulfobacteriota bacterium]|nr:hypothetical protein [Thermodesulfobacteriota bacterium]
MKKAIIIPIYMRLNRPEELAHSEGLMLAKRAIESLNLLKDQNFILILPVCFDPNRQDEENFFLDMDKFLRQEFRRLREGKIFLFSSHQLKTLRRYLDQRGFRKLSS